MNEALKTKKHSVDICVVGGGIGGMFTAISAARNGAKVLLLEKMEKPARKIRITGKGRCNLTNARGEEEFQENIRTNYDFMKVAYSEFNNRATMRFFERMGVKLKTERGDRVFPESGKAADIAFLIEENAAVAGGSGVQSHDIFAHR